MTQLSAQQQAGIEKIKAWYTGAAPDLKGGGSWGADVFRLFGYAGTGKTTMAKEIPAALGVADVRYATYTGKAAHVLRSKGASPVSTIHSGIYMPTSSVEARMALANAREELEALWSGIEAEDGPADDLKARVSELEALIPGLEVNAKRVAWEFNPMSEWANADLIILDEVSMVNVKLASDIESYGVPILVLGDPAQLPPVEGGGYYTNATPNHLLTEIHRQALEDPITALATRIRESTGSNLGMSSADMRPASMQEALAADQVLVWTNRRRWLMVEALRKLKKLPSGEVAPGDRIMCLTNNKDLAVFNGEQFEVLAVKESGGANYELTVLTEEGVERTIPTIRDAFMGRELQDAAKSSGAGMRGNWMLATFAQAITVHKAQGSEWDSVYVVNETPVMIAMGMKKSPSTAVAQARQWAYTAATRARRELIITEPRLIRY